MDRLKDAMTKLLLAIELGKNRDRYLREVSEAAAAARCRAAGVHA